MKKYELCETCIYYDTDENDVPCCSCFDGVNYEESDEVDGYEV